MAAMGAVETGILLSDRSKSQRAPHFWRSLHTLTPYSTPKALALPCPPPEVPGPCAWGGLLLRLPLRHHHPQVLPGPPQRSHGAETRGAQQRQLLPHHLLCQPGPGANGSLPVPGPLAAHAQLHSLQPGQPPLRRAGLLLPEGSAASELLQRQDRLGAPGPLLRAACEGEGTVPHPHRPACSEPKGEMASFKTFP
ncbi:ciliary microtubule inner protein 2C isoform X3 [Cavia porcellus]|uniref:ciliary microtubule inner protein 2C isoform X3 n=1 Tax=Cavia porcellus TaxID=10141 RepID=UPI002FE22B3D